MSTNRCILGMVAAAITVAALAGCSETDQRTSEQSYTVKGTVTKGGKPLPLDPVLAERKSARVDVQLVRDTEGGGTPYSTSAVAGVDGAFEISQVPAGKYKIGVVHADGKSPDTLRGKFDVRRSKIEREINGDTTLNIDLDKPDA